MWNSALSISFSRGVNGVESGEGSSGAVHQGFHRWSIDYQRS